MRGPAGAGIRTATAAARPRGALPSAPSPSADGLAGPLRLQVGVIVGVFVAIVACLVLLAYAQMQVLDGIRAYVGGEALWSKGQKDAVHHLVRYASSGSEAEFRRYREAIAVPLGDHRARLELDRHRPDPEVVRDGFVQGRNHPEDVPGMASLFRRFRHVAFMEKAIAIWAAGDAYVTRVQGAAAMLHQEIGTGHPDPDRVAGILTAIDALDARLTMLESRFSLTLARGARHTKALLLRTMLVTAGLLVAFGVALSWIVLRRTRAWETRYRHLLDTASDAILVTDVATGRVVEANRRATELTGLPRARRLGSVHAELYLDDDRRRMRAVLAGELPGGQATVDGLHLRRGERRVVPVEVSAAVTQLAGRRVVQTILRDVTERAQAERERGELLLREQAAREEAERASRTKDEFLSVLSHELRTPLTPILAWARVLQRAAPEPATLARALVVIERNARAQARLVEELLDVSRIISGKLRLDLQPIDPADAVEAAVEAERVAADAKDVHVVAAVPRGLGLVAGDADRLRQVVWNLLSNAVKFTSPGGRVDVVLTREAGRLALSVRDTGVGIRSELLACVFDRFWQADSSPAREHGGLGLGLAIVRHLVELHRGTVEAASAGEGCGATFTVRLPVLDAAPAVSARPGAPPDERRPSLAGLRVLVVDDDADTCDLVAAVLDDAGAESRRVSSVAEAMETLAGWWPDAIVSDLGMPGEDGFALVRQVRARTPAAGPRPATIALTAYASRDDYVRVRDAGFDAHVTKPFEPAVLVRSLAAAAGRS